jgi:hypothetical protein
MGRILPNAIFGQRGVRPGVRHGRGGGHGPSNNRRRVLAPAVNRANERLGGADESRCPSR